MTSRDDANESTPGPPAVEPEPDFEPLVPGLERVSPDAFRTGTLSRRRIVRAALLFAVVVIVIAGAIWLTRPV